MNLQTVLADVDLNIDYMGEDEVSTLLDRLIGVSDEIPAMTADGITYTEPGKFLRSIKTDLENGPPVIKELALCHLGKFARCLRLARACDSHGMWENVAREVDNAPD